VLSTRRELLELSLPEALETRERFDWKLGKCDARHWLDVLERFARFLAPYARRVRTEALVDEKCDEEGGRTRGPYPIGAINWILEFTREILENCSNSELFEHGAVVSSFLMLPETSESALRVIAAGTKKTVVGKTLRHPYFTSEHFRPVRDIVHAYERQGFYLERAATTGEDSEGRDNETSSSFNLSHTSRIKRGTETHEFTMHLLYSGLGGGELRMTYERRSETGEFHTSVERKVPEGLSLVALIEDVASARLMPHKYEFHSYESEEDGAGVYRPFDDSDNVHAVFAAHHALVTELRARALRKSPEGRGKLKRMACLATQISLHLGKKNADHFEATIEDGSSLAVELLNTMYNNTSSNRRDAMNCLSAFINERSCGFQICQIVRRAAGRAVLSEVTSAIVTSLTSSMDDSEQDYDIVLEARSLMHLLGILSTSPPGCATIKEAELLPSLVSMLKDERVQHVSVIVDAVHTLESYLDFAPSAVHAFRDLNGVESLLARMSHETRVALEECQASSEPDRKRKADSLSSLEDADVVTTSAANAPKYVSYHRRVLLKALMRTLAYTSFAVGGSRARIPGLSDGTLTNSIARMLMHPLKFGPGVAALAANLLCDIIHNEPTCYTSMNDAGIVDSYLRFITEDLWPLGPSKTMAKILCAIPTTLNAICLNENGLQKVLKLSAFVCFRKMFEDTTFPLNSDTAKVVGTALNETLRHSPPLQQLGVEILCGILTHAREQCVEGDARTVAIDHALVTKEVVEQMPKVKLLQNVMRFFDGVLSTNHMCVPLIKAGGLKQMLELVTCPVPVEFSQCSAYQAMTSACKSLINPPDNAGNFMMNGPPDDSEETMHTCAQVLAHCRQSAERLTASMKTFTELLNSSYPSEERMELLSSFDIYSATTTGREDQAEEVEFCRRAKELCEQMASHERMCELLTSLIAAMPAMIYSLATAETAQRMQGDANDHTFLEVKMECFRAASKIEAVLSRPGARVPQRQQPYSPIWWLHTRAEQSMRASSAFFSAVAKFSTTVRRRKDLGVAAVTFKAKSSETVWHLASTLVLALRELRKQDCKGLSQGDLDAYQRQLQGMIALSYETFFDARRSSPNAVMISYSARSGIFKEFKPLFQETVDVTNHILDSVQVDQSNPLGSEEAVRGIELTTECYKTLSGFARLFESVSDVKQVASSTASKVALHAAVPTHIDPSDISHLSSIPEVPLLRDSLFQSPSRVMDWIHYVLNDTLKCMWRPELARFAALMTKPTLDSILNCFLNILGGTEQAKIMPPKKPQNPIRLAPPPPPRFVPSDQMVATIAEMGFPPGHAYHAIAAVQGRSVESAMEYLLTHPMDEVPVEVPTPTPTAPVEEEASGQASTHVESTTEELAAESEASEHIMKGHLPELTVIIDSLYAYLGLCVEKAAKLMQVIVDKHSLFGMERQECIEACVSALLCDRSDGTRRDAVMAMKLYSFTSAVADQGDANLTQLMWHHEGFLDNLVSSFIGVSSEIIDKQDSELPVYFSTMAKCINTAASLQKVEATKSDGKSVYKTFGFLSNRQLIDVSQSCIQMLSVAIRMNGEKTHEYKETDSLGTVLDLLANTSRDASVVELVMSAPHPTSPEKRFPAALFEYFWNFENESVSVILRHLADDKKSLQTTMEFEIVKSITKPPLGRDRKVALKTFCTALKHVLERDPGLFQTAFSRVAEVKSEGQAYGIVVPKDGVDPSTFSEAKPSKNLRTVVELLLGIVIEVQEPLESTDPADVRLQERQAAAFRLLTELVEVHPSSVKIMMKFDTSNDFFIDIIAHRLPSSRHSKKAATGFWSGAENAAFFLATLCVNNAKARSRILEKVVYALHHKDDDDMPKHACVDLLHALMDYALARGYQSGERLRNRVVFNLQQGLLKSMYQMKLPEKLISLIRDLHHDSDNLGMLRVILAVLESLITRSTKNNRQNRLARISHALRRATAAAGRVADDHGVADAETMLETIIANAGGGNIQVTRIIDDDADEDVEADVIETMDALDGEFDEDMNEAGEDDGGIDFGTANEYTDMVIGEEFNNMGDDDDDDDDDEEDDEMVLHEGEEVEDEDLVDAEDEDSDDSSEEDSEEDSEEEDSEEEEEDDALMLDDTAEVAEDADDYFSDDGLYDDEDGGEYDAYEAVTDEEDDDDDEEGDFEEPDPVTVSNGSPHGVRVLSRAYAPGFDHTLHASHRQRLEVDRTQVERWLNSDYSTVMSGADPRVEARVLNDLEIAGGVQVSVGASTENSSGGESQEGTRPESQSTENVFGGVFTHQHRDPSIWSTDDENTGRLRFEGMDVQRDGSNLNITLSAPMDMTGRRSLQEVLTSISGEMARLAVRPSSSMEYLDPLSSAKAILWLGDGTYQAQAPSAFRVRDQTYWSLDGRHARASFWSGFWTIGDSVCRDADFLNSLAPKSAVPETAVDEEMKAPKEVSSAKAIEEVREESVEERSARQHAAAAALGIDSNQLALLSAELRDGFLEANRLAAQARAILVDRESRSATAASIVPIDLEFISALPTDIQRELIRTTTAHANAVLQRRLTLADVAQGDQSIPLASTSSAGRDRDSDGARPSHWTRGDIDRLGRSAPHSTEVTVRDEDEFKPFKAHVELSESNIRTLLGLFKLRKFESKETVSKICVNLSAVDSNRHRLMRQIFEEILLSRLPSVDGLDEAKKAQHGVRDRVSLTHGDVLHVDLVIKRLLGLFASLVTRNKHVQDSTFIQGMPISALRSLFTSDELPSTSPSDVSQVDDVIRAVSREKSGDCEVVDVYIEAVLLQMMYRAPANDSKVHELLATCLDALIERPSFTNEVHPDRRESYQRISNNPRLISNATRFLDEPYLSTAAYDKFIKVFTRICEASFTAIPCVLEDLQHKAVSCANNMVQAAKASRGESGLTETSKDVILRAKNTVVDEMPRFNRLTTCFVKLLMHLRDLGRKSLAVGACIKTDTDYAENLVRYAKALRPMWEMLGEHAVLIRDERSDSNDAEGETVLFDRASTQTYLYDGINAYMLIASELFPLIEPTISRSRRQSGIGVLPSHGSSLFRALSPAPGMSSGALQRTSSQMFTVLAAAGGEESEMAAVLGEVWRFVENHRDVLNNMLRSTPQLLSSSLKLLLQNPRLLDFDVKRNHLRQQIRKLRDRAPRVPNRQLLIRREYILQDSYNQLRNRSGDELHSKLTVVFKDEEGMDGGGLTKEWFTILAREIFNPNIALFELSHEGCYQPNPNSVINPEHLSYFRFVGRLVGKALFDEVLLNAYFTRPIYKHILGMPLTYEDMEGVDPDYYKGLKWLLENSIDGVVEYTFSETTNFFGETQVHDLVENGRNMTVTDENKLEYVNLVTAHRMTNAVKEQISAFVNGFEEVIPRDLISILNAAELELLISGTPDIDIEDLRANTDYHGGYGVGSKQIQWFWEVLRELSKENLARLLMFSTGTSKVPLDGFAALQGMQGPQKFQIHRVQAEDSKLPTAHTCFNQLDLPEYSSKVILRERLTFAIENGSEGFAFV